MTEIDYFSKNFMIWSRWDLKGARNMPSQSAAKFVS